MPPYYNPHWQLACASKNLYKYLAGGAGRRLALAQEEKLGIDGRLPQHYLRYHRQWMKRPMEWIHMRPRPERFEKDEFGLVRPVQVRPARVRSAGQFRTRSIPPFLTASERGARHLPRRVPPGPVGRRGRGPGIPGAAGTSSLCRT
jgi:hypothetical protein